MSDFEIREEPASGFTLQLPAEVGYNLRHRTFFGQHFVGLCASAECPCRPEKVPHTTEATR